MKWIKETEDKNAETDFISTKILNFVLFLLCFQNPIFTYFIWKKVFKRPKFCMDGISHNPSKLEDFVSKECWFLTLTLNVLQWNEIKKKSLKA